MIKTIHASCFLVQTFAFTLFHLFSEFSIQQKQIEAYFVTKYMCSDTTMYKVYTSNILYEAINDVTLIHNGVMQKFVTMQNC